MARHRSPKGRRAHLEPPLPAVAAAGVGGAHRSIPITQLTSSLPVRFIATAVAGGALAAVGQHALIANLPATSDDSNVLRLGVQELLGSDVDPAAAAGSTSIAASTAVAPSALTGPLVTLAPVAGAPDLPAEPDVADARDLVKAAEMQRKAVEADVADANAKAEAATRAALDKAVNPDKAKDKAKDKGKDPAADAAKTDAAKTDAAKTGDADDDAPGRVINPKNQAGAAAGAAAAAGEAAEGAVPDKPRADTSSLGGGAIQMITGRVTSGFGARWGVRHEGLDIAAPIGTPIRVPIGGTVIDSGPASGFGLWVRVQHVDGTVTTYGHINRSFVTKGQQVSAGQKIAEVGNRGQSTGPHLHIEVSTPAGTKINPRPWLDQHDISY